MEKIKFANLSIWLKLGIIGGLITFGYFVISFLAGFIIGLGEGIA